MRLAFAFYLPATLVVWSDTMSATVFVPLTIRSIFSFIAYLSFVYGYMYERYSTAVSVVHDARRAAVDHLIELFYLGVHHVYASVRAVVYIGIAAVGAAAQVMKAYALKAQPHEVAALCAV